VARSRVHVTDHDKGYARLLRDLHDLGPIEAVVGIREEKGKHAYDADEVLSKGGTSGDMGLTVAAAATVNEYGSEDGRIPERSFMRSTFDENRDRYAAGIRIGIEKAIDGSLAGSRPVHGGVLEVIEVVAAVVVGDVQEKIVAGPFKPNAPYTIRKKGSSKPLIDTGRMRQSIDYEIRERARDGSTAPQSGGAE
jgi:hypothetical protein